MTDREIIDWISGDPDRRLMILSLNYNSGFMIGLSFRDMAERVIKWYEEIKR